MFYKRFVLIKPLQINEDTLQQGTQIDVVNDKIYVNGGQIMPSFYIMFEKIVEDYVSGRDKSLIREVNIPYNKI